MKKKQCVVWGLGRFGSSVAKTLESLGNEVLGIDSNADIVQELSSELTHVVIADKVDKETVNELGLDKFDIGIVAIGELEANVLCTMLLKETNIPLVVSKAGTLLHGSILEKIGADKVIYPERDMGQRVAHNIVGGSILDYIDLADDLTIVELSVPKSFIGKNLIELNLRQAYGVNVVAIRKTSKTIVGPNPKDAIDEDDIMVIMGLREDVLKMEEIL